jgi:large subunit ribosomal protein L1
MSEKKQAEAVEAPKAKTSKKKASKPAKKKVVLNFDKNKAYPIAEAVKFAKESGREKFDASVEVHFKLGIDTKKGEQQVRGTAALPHGIGKTVRIAAFVEPANEAAAKAAGADFIGNEEFIAQVKKTEKTDFDLAIAEPSMMKKMGLIAKILGTRGLMPSPKNDTVTTDPAKAVSEFKKGKLSFKNDDTGNIHLIIGKKSFDDAKLVENYQTLVDIIKKSKPSAAKGTFIRGITVCTSMGAGVKVQVE